MESVKKQNIAISIVSILLSIGFIYGCIGACKKIKKSNTISLLEKNGFEIEDELKKACVYENNSIFRRISASNTDEVYIKVNGNDDIRKIVSSFKKDNNAIGLIVSPSDNTLGSLYKLIDDIKKVMIEFDIELPIYFNVDSLKDNKKVNQILGEEFCRKLEANGLYVGLYGKDDSITDYVNTYLDSHDSLPYDVMVEMTGNTINYPYKYNGVTINNGEVFTSFNMKDVIKKNNLNNPLSFVDDYKYVVESGDTLSSISERFNISVDNICIYNNIVDKNKINIGDVIVLPNIYSSYEEEKVEVEDKLLKGIDAAKYQGDIDWERISDYIDFAMLKVYNPKGEPEIDPKFHVNIKSCNELSIPVGCYFYSHATSVDEIKLEIDRTVEELKDVKLDCPLYIDVETDDILSLSKDELRNVLNEGCLYIASLGYVPGIYINSSHLDIVDGLDWQIWTTNSTTYNTSTSFDDFKNDEFSIDGIKLDGKITCCQYCRYGKIDGINADVDFDYALPSIIVNRDEKVLKKQQ